MDGSLNISEGRRNGGEEGRREFPSYQECHQYHRSLNLLPPYESQQLLIGMEDAQRSAKEQEENDLIKVGSEITCSKDYFLTTLSILKPSRVSLD